MSTARLAYQYPPSPCRHHVTTTSPAGRERLYLEYPAAPPRPFELPAPPLKKSALAAGEKEGGGAEGFSVGGSAAYTVEDYVLPYASDDD